jgi:magnesium transporter
METLAERRRPLTCAPCTNASTPAEPATAAEAYPLIGDIEALRQRHPSDIADILEQAELDPSELVDILLKIGNSVAGETFSRLSMETQKACLEAGPVKRMLQLVEHMEPDDRVDLLKKVDPEVSEGLMPLIAQAERNATQRLWEYEEGTAGAEMTTEYAFLPADITVGEALAQLRLQAPNRETIYYVYITDAERHLLGVISLRHLIMSKPRQRLCEVMTTDVISVPHHASLDTTVQQLTKYDFIALPVVDHQNRLLGIVTFDDAMDIVKAENTEDFQRISAVLPFEEEYLRRPLGRLFWNRFCWLAILLFTSILSTSVMAYHAGILHQMVALSFFIPMVIGASGNAGTQSATMVVRAMALGEIRPRDFPRVFSRELFMGLALGLALGAMALLRVFWQEENLRLGYIVATALLATLLTANLVGSLLPLLLKKLRLDPALTAGPFIATIIDAAGIAIYFQVAIWLMRG